MVAVLSGRVTALMSRIISLSGLMCEKLQTVIGVLVNCVGFKRKASPYRKSRICEMEDQTINI